MDWREIKDEKEKYQAYLCSREWGEKKEAVRKRSKGKCERCLVNDAGAVHHLTYARKYEELLEDLQAICNGCHEFVHGKSSIDPKEAKFITVAPEIHLEGKCSFIHCPLCRSDHINCDDIGHTPQRVEGSEHIMSAFYCTCANCRHSFKFVLWTGKYEPGLFFTVHSRRVTG